MAMRMPIPKRVLKPPTLTPDSTATVIKTPGMKIVRGGAPTHPGVSEQEAKRNAAMIQKNKVRAFVKKNPTTTI